MRQAPIRTASTGQHIADYALIGDLRTAALVSLTGSIDWLCLPRFDSPAMCAALLGDADHGHWDLAPRSGGRCSRRQYRPGTLVLETEWVTPDGAVRVTDFMAVGSAPSRLVRIVDGLAGSVTLRMRLGARMRYGQVTPSVTGFGSHAHLAAGADAFWLHSTTALDSRAGDVQALVRVAAGETVSFTLTAAPPDDTNPCRASRDWCATTERFWTGWIARCTYQGPWAAQVERSLIVLKALTYSPSGGIMAAATTSLPERIGGSRNWDYRFCWLRDAAFTLEAFLAAGYTDEAAAWRDWLLDAVADDFDDIPIMYSVDGSRCLPEQVLDWLPGHRGSAPVRIGNQAATQQQNDVWGEVLAVLGIAQAAGVRPAPGQAQLERTLFDRLSSSWAQPDHGMWEVRGPRRHFVHSKLRCWVGVDQVIRNLEAGPLPPFGVLNGLRELRGTIHAEICERGFDTAQASFTQAYDSPRLDAALLLLPRYGFLPWTDSRVAGTVEAVRRGLTRDGLVARYTVSDTATNVDGLPGNEGAFLACSFWLVDALHGLGRTDEAVELFDRTMSLSNDVGLLSEEYDPASGQQLGNTPQAFSHAGVVTTAIRLSQNNAGSHQHPLPAWEEEAS
jgi:GH15 family glucan-1,4-alpha-glucosidase